MFALAPLVSYAFVATFTPGPMNIMSMSVAARYGWRRTVGFTLGAMSSFAVVMMLSAFANLLLYSVLPRVQPVMNVIGAAYMLYLAWKMVRNDSRGHGAEPQAQEPALRNSFWGAVALQFVNVKVMLYGITVMGSLIMPYYRSPWLLVAFSLGLSALALMSTNCWALFGSMFQRLIVRHQRTFNVVMALLLVYCAVSLFLH